MAGLSTREVNVNLISHCPGAPPRFWPTSCVPSSVAMKNLLPGLRNPPRNVGQELAEGWSYIISSPAIRWILLMLTLVSVIGMPFTVLLPIVAAKVLGGGAHTLGFLTAATGVGALTSAMARVYSVGATFWASSC